MDFGIQVEDTDGTEKRIFERVGFGRPVEFQFADPARLPIGPAGSPVCYGGSLPCNISAGGIRLNFNDFVPLGTELLLQIHLELQKVVECLARVVWVRRLPFMERYQAGLEFIKSDSLQGARKEIQRFVCLQRD